MTDNPKRAWFALQFYAVSNQPVPMPADAPLDPQAWLHKHLLRWPEEFAYDDWSTYRPAIRRIRLIREEHA